MKKYLILIAILFCAAAAKTQVLNVPQVIQEQNQWCWAGSSKCILNYYGDSIEQCTIAEYARTVITWHSFGTVNCCTSADSGCNYWNYMWGTQGSIQDILVHFDSIQTTDLNAALTIPQIDSEISKNHLFVEHWSWVGGGGHFVVGHGIATTGSTSTIYYMNPWFGEGLHFGAYSYMLSGNIDSMGNHIWDLTSTIASYPHPVTNSVNEPAQVPADAIVYPNPSTGSIRVKGMTDDQVEIYNITGSLVYHTILKNSTSGLDLTNLPKGVYLVKIKSSGGNSFTKLVLQ